MVKEPVALRYGWEGWSLGNLGPWHDPVRPYRTDDWPIVSPDVVYDSASGTLSPAELRYLRGRETLNRRLEMTLQLGAEEADVNLLKRFAHPKPMMLSMLTAMETLLGHFNVEAYREMAPRFRKHALYCIPPRYWRRDRYSPARRAKWGWLIERVLRFEPFPQKMEAALESPAVKTKLAALRQAVSDLKAELQKLPDPEAMSFDEMLDKILPIMQKEKEALLKQGVDLRQLEADMRRSPF
jgi:hypothetical protein